MPDQYLRDILARERVDTSASSPVLGVQRTINPVIQDWAGTYLVGISPSGSFAKGTANSSGTDIDLFVSLSSSLTWTLQDIYESLFRRLQQAGLAQRRQNVSIGCRVGAYDVDVVPAKRQSNVGGDHSLYRRKADTWTKTNVGNHVNLVARSGRLEEIRIVKLWRAQKGLELPSFYLELTTIAALSGKHSGNLANNVWTMLQYLRDRFPNARVVDPANTSNIISDDLTATEKSSVAAAAARALVAKDWREIIT
jgi:hypothetical protein